MRRVWWAAPVLAAVLTGAFVAPGVSASPEPRAASTPAPWELPRGAGGWTAPETDDDDRRSRLTKARTLEFVRAQGGLWSTDVPRDAGGRLRTVPGSEEPPRAAEEIATVRVEVEVGLGVDGAEFARQVMATLNDPRGWGHDGSVAFARTDGEADIDLTLASPATTDALCAPVDTGGTVSCGRVGFAVLNAVRWAQGAEPFLAAGGTLAGYRQYLVNHEVGHVLGNPHVRCPGAGEVAPIMLQQTLGLDGCRPNGWPAAGG